MKFSVPSQFHSAKIDDVEPGMRDLLLRLTKQPRTHIINPGLFLFVAGPEGAGKTHAVAAMCNELMSKGWLVAWESCQTFPEDFEEARIRSDELSRPTILVLDDLGREPERTRRCLITPLHYRADVGKVTIVTTNLDYHEQDLDSCQVAKTYSRATRSRLLSGISVVMDGQDRRLT